MIADATLLAKLKATSPNEPSLAIELHKTKNVLKAVYDFTTTPNPTTVGAIPLLDDQGAAAALPPKAVITDAYVDVVTAPTSGGSATIALQAEAAADLLGATAVASVTGIIAGAPTGAAATYVKTTVARQIKAVVAVAALTAGKFNVFIEYVVSN